MNELGVLKYSTNEAKYRNKLDDGADQNAWAHVVKSKVRVCLWMDLGRGGVEEGASPDSLGETVHWRGTFTDVLILFPSSGILFFCQELTMSEWKEAIFADRCLWTFEDGRIAFDSAVSRSPFFLCRISLLVNIIVSTTFSGKRPQFPHLWNVDSNLPSVNPFEGWGQSPAGYRMQTNPQRTLGADSGCLQMLWGLSETVWKHLTYETFLWPVHHCSSIICCSHEMGKEKQFIQDLHKADSGILKVTSFLALLEWGKR